MGDDLVAARAFVDAAQTHLGVLLGEDRLNDRLAREAVKSLRDTAKPLHAKAIMRSGQRALALLKDQASQPKIDGAYIALNKLIVQYRQGLEEVEQALREQEDIAVVQTGAKVLSEAETEISPVLEAHKTDAEIALGYKQASATLISLLPLSVEPKQRRALEFLSGVVPSLSHPVSELDQRAKTGMWATKQMPTSVKTSLIQASSVKGPDVALETLMPSLTNSVLIAARQTDKTVSLGYSDNDIMVPAHLVQRVETELHALGRLLVTHILEPREVRSARGDSQSGQILVTAYQDKDDIVIDLECAGQDLSELQQKNLIRMTSETRITYMQSSDNPKGRVGVSLSVHLGRNTQVPDIALPSFEPLNTLPRAQGELGR